MNNPYWLNDLIWAIGFYIEDCRRFKRRIKGRVKRIIWYLRGEPTLEADLRRINADYNKLKKECK